MIEMGFQADDEHGFQGSIQDFSENFCLFLTKSQLAIRV